MPGAGGVPGARAAEGAGGVRVNVERTMAMLALTAFHDVMKVEALLPAVKPEHAPYLGFKEGDVINDHDIALGYVLDFHSHLLPSFVAMREHDQKTIRFTQSKMSFNHGWCAAAWPRLDDADDLGCCRLFASPCASPRSLAPLPPPALLPLCLLPCS